MQDGEEGRETGTDGIIISPSAYGSGHGVRGKWKKEKVESVQDQSDK